MGVKLGLLNTEGRTSIVYENRGLNCIFWSKREEVAGGRRKEKNLLISPNIIRAIKSRRMRWARHSARIGQVRNAYCI
jgi:hypothetical protein